MSGPWRPPAMSAEGGPRVCGFCAGDMHDRCDGSAWCEVTQQGADCPCGDSSHARHSCAHDELDALLMDHGIEASQAALLTRAIAEWAKDQDEDWPWQDASYNQPMDPTYPPMPQLKNPEAIIDMWARHHAVYTQAMTWLVDVHEGNPATFQVTHRELGPPLNETTRALAEHWAAVDWSVRTPDVVPWRPGVSICPVGRTQRTPTWEPQDWTWAGLPVVISDGVPKNPGLMLMQRHTEED